MLTDLAARMQRVGLILQAAQLSPEHRREAYALQRLYYGTRTNEQAPQAPQPKRLIGFAYPNKRG